jgi:hypothetical protein
VPDPTGPDRVAPIDPADIAAVAAVLLTEDGHPGENSFTSRAARPSRSPSGHTAGTRQARAAAETIGADIEARAAVTPDEVVKPRFSNGAPPVLTESIIEWYAHAPDTVGIGTDTVKRLLARAPSSFAERCSRHAAAFRSAG